MIVTLKKCKFCLTLSVQCTTCIYVLQTLNFTLLMTSTVHVHCIHVPDMYISEFEVHDQSIVLLTHPRTTVSTDD